MVSYIAVQIILYMQAKLRPRVSPCFSQTARRKKKRSKKTFLLERQHQEYDYFFYYENQAQEVSKN
jgi:hypothetical protein